MDSEATKARLFAEIVRTSPTAVAVLDRDLRYIANNDAWLAYSGLPAGSSLLGRLHLEVFPNSAPQRAEVFARCLAGNEENGSYTVPGPDGQPRHVRYRIAPWRDHDGAVGGMILYVEDVHAQVRTEQRLAERESLIRQLFERSPIGLNLCRMDGLWIESNPAFLDIIGYSQAEADGGLTYWQLTPRKYDADEAVQLEHLRTQRRYGPYEKEFIRKDGRHVPVRLNGFIVEREGESYIWSLIEDLTAQRELEARLEEQRVHAIQSSKLATIGEMAASLAHEINNPLGVIDAYAFTLKDAIASGDDQYIDEAIRSIRVATARAGKIVHGLRKFARQEVADPAEDQLLEAVIDDALDLCRARIRSHGVDLVVRVDTDARVHGHGIELSQVVVNLLNNAFDAARASASPRWIHLTARDAADPGSVEVVVEDSGAGVPAEIASAVFRPFFTTKEVGAGTGLGLSISRAIIERHGGQLVLDAEARPTRFRIVLPRAP